MAQEIAGRGASLLLLGQRPAEEVQDELSALRTAGAQVTYAVHDACDPQSSSSVLQTVHDLTGVVVNAGIHRGGAALDLSAQDWTETLDVNLTGAFFLAQAAARRLVKRLGGSIVLVSSWAAEIPDYGNAAYSVSKAGLNMLARSLALELGTYNVRVNCVAPGIVNAGMARRQLTEDEAYARRARTLIPLDRLQSAVDVATVTAFLLSEESSYVTGTTLLADGGASLFRRDS